MQLTPFQIDELRRRAAEYMLVAFDSYWQAAAKLLATMTGGCGAESARFDLVPDTVWGLCIKPACNIHDYMYAVGKTLAEKIQADSIFLYNMNRIVECTGGALEWPRKRRVYKYFLAVKYKGHAAFWENKDRDKYLLPM